MTDRRSLRAARAGAAMLALLAALGADGATASQPARAQAGDICAVPAELLHDESALPLASAALRRDNRLRILVVGTASALGAGASGPEAAYPARLEAELRRRLPRAEVKVATRGGRGLQAEQKLELIDAEVAANPVDLVIWQSGTVDAVSNIDPDQFANALTTGILRLRVRGADTMLMDMQFSRFVRANVDYAPYLRAFRRIGNQEDVIIFRRFDVMRHWAETEQIDLERARRSERERIVDQVHGCIARLLADMIQRGLRQ